MASDLNVPAMGMDLGPKTNINTTPIASPIETPAMAVPDLAMAPTMDMVSPIMAAPNLGVTPIELPQIGIAPPVNIPAFNPVSAPVTQLNTFAGIPSPRMRGRMADGGNTNKKLPNKGLEALEKVAPDVVEKMGFQEGGATDMMQDPITREAIQFIMGESDNQQIVNDFIAKYGNDMFLQLRDSVLKSLVPGAQTEGLIRGEGRSGMADDIPGMIGADEKIAVSQDEFIVPADVVSALGDGSSDAGSNALYDMMDRVRQAKTGGTTQPPMIDLNKVMPA